MTSKRKRIATVKRVSRKKSERAVRKTCQQTDDGAGSNDNGTGGGGGEDRQTTGCEGTDRELPRESPIVKAMEAFCAMTVKKTVEGLKAEFAELANFVPADISANAFKTNVAKNRFANIPCYDRTRVVLKFAVPPECDYIHANYVDTSVVKLTNRYICAQAPMDTTVGDWWRMIWQEKPKHILMLCKTIENGRSKCAQYFPNGIGEQLSFGPIVVQFVRNVNSGNEKAYESSNLRVSIGKEGYQLVLHRWNDWPDFGVPSNGMGLLRLLRSVRTDPGTTALIHCSAGVGRTGTIMALELGLRALLDGKECQPLEIVKELRSQRACCVQTEGQYVFVHRCLIEFIKAKKLAKNEVAEFATQYAQYKRALETQQPQTAPLHATDTK
uniref:Protein-tyrosine phosphatase n=1 Tax=Panagrellus redivivus TaxID=6233 RepID=A0A7E4ZUS6_PANRE